MSATEQSQEPRRSVLRDLAVVGAGLALAGLARPSPAAAHEHAFEGFNDVTTVPPAGTPGSAVGADPTGTSDSTDAIQTWINVSGAGGSKPGTVYFPPGAYRIGQSLRLVSKSVLLGHGPLSVIKIGAPYGAPIHMLSQDQSSITDVVIDNLTLDGNKNGRANPNTNRTCPETLHPNDSLIRLTCERLHIRRVTGRNAGGGGSASIYLNDPKNAIVEECDVRDGHKDGIGLYGQAEDVVIRNNVVMNHVDDEIAVPGIGQSAKRITVVGNVAVKTEISSTTTGWKPSTCINAAEHYVDVAGAPIAVRGGEQIVITGNTCYGGVQAGIVVSGATDAVVTNNVVTDVGNVTPPECPDPPLPTGCPGVLSDSALSGSGIFLRLGASGSAHERMIVAGNSIKAPQRAGVLIGGLSPGAVDQVAVNDNVIQVDPAAAWIAGDAPGISCESPSGPVTGLQIRGNEIRDARGPGISVTKGSADVSTVDIHDNNVTNSGKGAASQPGIRLAGIESPVVLGNRAQNTDGANTQNHGLSITSPTEAVLVTGNYFANNPGGGVHSSGIGTDVHIYENVNAAAQNPLS